MKQKDRPTCLNDRFPDVAIRIESLSALSMSASAIENDIARNFADGRRREFLAGRQLARCVLRDLGLTIEAIRIDKSRRPIWPRTIVGSISHTRDYVGVAIAGAEDYAGIGLDIEEKRAVTSDLLESILTESEYRRFAELDQSCEDLGTLVFSAKEAVYKAVNPCTDEFLEFSDLEIEIDGNDFSAVCTPSRISSGLVSIGKGTYRESDDAVQTLFTIPRSGRIMSE